MSDLHQTKCLNHSVREAVARCPECRKFFCRECVTEHESRLICAACLQKIDVPDIGKRRAVWRSVAVGLGNAGRMLIGLFLVWFVFYAVGQLLLLIPDSFHSGDMWKAI